MHIDQRNNSKLLWIITGGLVVIAVLIALFFAFSGSSNDQQTNTQIKPAAPEQPLVATPSAAQHVEQIATSQAANVELVKESILKDSVPENSSLAKEEVAKLDDIQKQLDEQQQNLKSQHADADQLLKLKEEQVKLLEQQLAAQAKA